MKKERYFAPENLLEKACDMLLQVETLGIRHEQILLPGKSALLVLDMQRYFLEESSHAFTPASEAIIPGIARLVESYSRKEQPIIFTRHLNSAAGAGMMSRWWRDLLRPDNPLSEITPEFKTSQGIIIEKEQYDAFHQTDLEKLLRDRGITQAVICGVMTHLCCETTARSAFMRGFEVFFTVDGTASYAEAFHRAALLNLAHGFAVLTLVDEIISQNDAT